MDKKVTHISHNNMGKDKLLITHDDMDGIGCAVIFLKAFPQGQVISCGYGEVNQVVMEELSRDKETDVLITDISVLPEVAELLDKRGKVGLLDHHATASWLNKYEWATVEDGKCGTRLTFELLSRFFHLADYEKFVGIVEDWDLWGKGEGPSEVAIQYQFLFNFLGRDRFLQQMLKDPHIVEEDETTITIMTCLVDQYDEYYQDTVNLLELHNKDGYTMGIVICDRYVSLIGSRLCEDLDLEYVLMIDPRRRTASLRGKGNIDLGQLAKQAGGGGHRRAAGFQMDNLGVVNLINSMCGR